MGFYGQRVGAIHFICKSKNVTTNVMSQLKMIIRPMYSNPPRHGAIVCARILKNP